MAVGKKAAWIAAGAAGVVLVLLVVLPYLFRGPLIARAQAELSRSVEAEVSWGRAGLSLVRGFPNATLSVDELAVVGRERFEGDTLARADRFRVVVELPSILRSVRGRGPLVVRAVELDRPRLDLRVLEDGTANWEIARESEREAGEPGAWELRLRRLEIRDADVRYDDRQAGMTATARGLRQSLSGDFRQARFTLNTRADAESVAFRFGGVPFLTRAVLAVDTELDVDLGAGRIEVRRSDVRLNGLRLELGGDVVLGEEDVGLDLAFRAPGTEFREILSLVPAVYRHDFDDLEARGAMAVAGHVRGAYGPSSFPALSLDATVTDGWFRYPDLPLPARDVALALSVRNPGGDPDLTVVRLDGFQVVIGSDPVRGSFALRTPVSDPDVELAVSGRLDLADLQRTFRLDGAEELAGLLNADASMRARLSDIDRQRYERVHADGSFGARGVIVRTADLPHALEVDEAELRFTPAHAELAAFRGRVGSSDLDVTGRVDNLLGFALRDEELRGEARIASRYFDLDEWRSDEEAEAVLVPRNLDVRLVADVQRLAFAELDLRNARGALHLRDQRATLDDFQLDMFGGGLAVSGYYETIVPDRPTFDLDLRLAGIQVGEAAAGLVTVRTLAPVARYADGGVSTELRLSGALGPDLTPQFDALSGRGAFETAGLTLRGFPGLDTLADLLETEALRNPALQDLRSSFTIHEGRLHVSPFDVRIGQFAASVAGSHGFDETMDYGLTLHLPASALGPAANRAIGSLAARAGRVGTAFQPADVISLGVTLGGTVRSPTVDTDFQGTATTALHQAGDALRGEAERRVEAIAERVDAAAEAARHAAHAEAARLLAEAERQAERIRAEARPLAEAVRHEGHERADALVAGATSPAARVAARTGADRLRREADQQADRILQEADGRADALLADARVRADSLTSAAGSR